MSIEAMKWAWQQECSSAAEKLVLMALADNADNDGYCWPGNARTAERCQMSEASVRRHLKHLDESGLVAKVKRRRRSDGTLSVWIYRLDIEDNRTTAHPLPVDIHAQKTVHPCTKVCAPVSAQEPSVESTLNPHSLLRTDEIEIVQAEIVDQSETDFEHWWKQYPRHEEKKQAKAQWTKLKSHERMLALQALPEHLAHWKRERTDPKYIPYGVRWLRNRRWEDELVSDYKPAMSVREQAIYAALQDRHAQEHNDDTTGRDESDRELGWDDEWMG